MSNQEVVKLNPKQIIWLIRNGGDELELGKRGAWLLVWNTETENYIQFHSFDQLLVGVKIGIRRVVWSEKSTKKQIRLRVETLTGTILEGDMVNFKNQKNKASP